MNRAAALLMLFAALALPNAAAASPSNAPSTYEASSSAAPTVDDIRPAPGTRLRSFFPSVSATIQTRGGAALKRGSLRLFVDGVDVTRAAALSGPAVTYTPRERMRAGWHDVFLEGSDTAKRAFSEAWVFHTEDPDVDVPLNDQDSFAFLPIGVGQPGSPFMHFFLISPFEGVGLLQLCGFEVPLSSAVGTPVFFVTVPVTTGTLLLGCTPGIAFTPFGIGQVSPIFFPIGVAGPNFFQNPSRRRIQNAPAAYRGTMPVYRASGMPGYRTTGMPVYRIRTPVYAAPPGGVPQMRTTMPVIRAPGSTAGHASVPALPRVIVPHPYIPHGR